MNIKTILGWFGFDVKKPLAFIMKALALLDQQALVNEVQNALCLNMTAARKKEVAGMLTEAATALNNGDCTAFAKVVAAMAKGIKL